MLFLVENVAFKFYLPHSIPFSIAFRKRSLLALTFALVLYTVTTLRCPKQSSVRRRLTFPSCEAYDLEEFFLA
jgi:hypothetical protein